MDAHLPELVGKRWHCGHDHSKAVQELQGSRVVRGQAAHDVWQLTGQSIAEPVKRKLTILVFFNHKGIMKEEEKAKTDGSLHACTPLSSSEQMFIPSCPMMLRAESAMRPSLSASL